MAALQLNEVEALAKRVAQDVMNGDRVILIGAPGTPKTAIARRVPDYLLPLSQNEMDILAGLYRDAGLSRTPNRPASRVPFRAPHYTISMEGLFGDSYQPGEVSLATYGVLFLDEVNEFEKNTLWSLDAAMRLKHVSISNTVQWPSYFHLVGAMMWCPCGYAASSGQCMCSPDEIAKHMKNIPSDLFDIEYDLDRPSQRASYTRKRVGRGIMPTGHTKPAPQTEKERLRDFFFGKPGSRKARGLSGLPSWDKRRR